MATVSGGNQDGYGSRDQKRVWRPMPSRRGIGRGTVGGRGGRDRILYLGGGGGEGTGQTNVPLPTLPQCPSVPWVLVDWSTRERESRSPDCKDWCSITVIDAPGHE